MPRGKRYTAKEDDFIVEYFDSIGPFIGPHDLGRSEASVKARAKFLKKSGAWEAIKTAKLMEIFARHLAGTIPASAYEMLYYEFEEMERRGWLAAKEEEAA